MLQLTARTRLSLLLFSIVAISSIIPLQGFCQSNDLTGVPSLTSVTSCTLPTSGNPTYTLNSATPSTGVPAGCITGGDGNHYDAWFSFTAANTTETVSIGNLGSKITNPEVQIFSGTTFGNFVSNACGSTTATATGLTVGTTYFIRVSNVGASPSGTGQTPKFDICLTHPVPPPANDDCSGAITLTSGSTNNSGTVWNATASSNIPTGCLTGDPDDDVWYAITTSTFSNSLTVNLSSIGTDLNTSGARIQVFTGGCGSLASYACGSNSLTTPVSGNTTYYIRVYSAGTGALSSSSGSTFSINATVSGPTVVIAGRNNEVFKQTTLSGSGALLYPWEITYGPDNNLWITESRGYKVHKMDPNTGAKTTVLDLNSNSTDLTAFGADSLRAFNLTSTSNWNGSALNWPQGGLAGLAIHPNFGDGSGHDYVYISYVHRFLSTAAGSAGIFFRNKIVRFTYNSSTGKLGTPAVVCDTIPGGQDHNSQRMIIAPVTAGGTNYLFYAAGDMGAGQFANRLRPQNAQNIASYEGKILRFNLEPDADGDETVPNAWIPNTNPYNTMLGKQSAVYSTGIRNNQGFAYDTLTNKLYGSSHGPYSDDEINVIEGFRNYGHPLIQGFAADGNYNGNTASGTNTSVSAGAPYTDNLGVSTCPPIGNEANNKTAIDAAGKGAYKDPMFSAYAASAATVLNLWQTNPGNALPAPGWPTEAWSGLDLYSNKLIPGWKRSLVAASLKWGRLVRIKLNGDGEGTAPANNVTDTVSYFNSQNRFRDLAFSPDGKDIFVVMDNNSTTSGPGSANPVVPNCAGCVQKYTFLGYADAGGKSTIDTSIGVTAGGGNMCNTGTTITIDNSNSNLWVPITGPDGNIMAEIYANGNNLGTVTSSFYTNSGAIRAKGAVRYLNRNLTITPQNQPAVGSPVKVRLYMTKSEFDALDADVASGVSAITDLKILKNNDVCSSAPQSPTTVITPLFAEAHGSNGYMLEASITGFSSFYFAAANFVLPVDLITFTGTLQNNSALLKWTTENESNLSHFVVERSIDGNNFTSIGQVKASGNSSFRSNYSLTDDEAESQQSDIVYYRLMLVDKDNIYKYSKVITISLYDRNSVVTVSPNPVSHSAQIRINGQKTGTAQWKLVDNNGRAIQQGQVNVQKGIPTSFQINMESVAIGTYYLQVTGAGLDRNVKVQKM